MLSEEMERTSLRNRVSREAYVRKIYVVVRWSTVAVRGRPTKSFVNGNYVYIKNVAQWLQLIAVVTDSSRKEIWAVDERWFWKESDSSDRCVTSIRVAN